MDVPASCGGAAEDDGAGRGCRVCGSEGGAAAGALARAEGSCGAELRSHAGRGAGARLHNKGWAMLVRDRGRRPLMGSDRNFCIRDHDHWRHHRLCAPPSSACRSPHTRPTQHLRRSAWCSLGRRLARAGSSCQGSWNYHFRICGNVAMPQAIGCATSQTRAAYRIDDYPTPTSRWCEYMAENALQTPPAVTKLDDGLALRYSCALWSNRFIPGPSLACVASC